MITGKAALAGLGLVVLAAGWPAPAPAVPTELIANGEFGTDASPSLTSWTPAGTANARAGTDTINTSLGNAGFNSFFTSAFAVLGDVNGDTTGPPLSGVSSISQTFVLPATLPDLSTVATWDLTVSFWTAFDGKNNTIDASAWDTFTATLTGIAGSLFAAQYSSGFPNCGPLTTCTNSQLTQTFSAVYAGLLPGSYTLTFSLDEKGVLDPQSAGHQLTQTAAGIDKVSAEGTANLAAVPEPAGLLLWGLTAASLALASRRTRRQ